MAVFRKFKGLNINCRHWKLEPPKGTSFAGKTSFDVFFVKNSFTGLGCSELQVPNKSVEKYSPL